MAGIIDHQGNILLKEKIPLNLNITKDYLVKNILNMSWCLMNECTDNNIDCIGVAVPDTADSEKGILLFAPYSGIRNFEIGKILEKGFHIPVFVENDANACAYGEMLYGACRGSSNFIWITVSNGIGGALVLNNLLYKGTSNGAGEIGHINVVENGYHCGYGNKGCLEVYASGPAIVRRYKEKNKYIEISAKTIADASRNGDRPALEIFRETGYYLGKAISYAINLVNPQKVVLGGGVAMSIDLFLPEKKWLN